MAKNSITSFHVETIQDRTGFLGRKTTEDELLRMDTAGGSIYLRKSAVERAGDNWEPLKRRMWNLAREKEIPFTDHTE